MNDIDGMKEVRIAFAVKIRNGINNNSEMNNDNVEN